MPSVFWIYRLKDIIRCAGRDNRIVEENKYNIEVILYFERRTLPNGFVSQSTSLMFHVLYIQYGV